MSGVIKCPNCKTPMFVAEEMIGQVMACPTCQRPIRFVGQSAVASSSSAAPTAPPPLPAVPPVAKSTLPKAAPLAPAAPILPALEPAPAAPKYSAEVSQFALQPVTSAPPPPKPRDETISPAVLITWIVLGLLVVGSGAVVAVASFRGMSHEPVAKLPKSSVPPIPPSQRAFSRPFSAPPKAQQAADDSGAATVVPTLSTTQAEDNETETSDGPESPSAPQPTPKAMPTILPAQQQPRATTGIPGSPVGQETALPAATSVPVDVGNCRWSSGSSVIRNVDTC